MIPDATVVSLLLMLIVVVYGYVVVLGLGPQGSRSVRTPWAIIAIAGTVPFAAWLLVPDAFGVGRIDLTIAIRRTAPAVGGVAVVMRYATLRAKQRIAEAEALLRWLSAVTLTAAVTVGTANWLVAAGFAITAAAAGSATSAASCGADPTQPPDPRGS